MQAQLSPSDQKIKVLYSEAVALLKDLISIPSFSKEEHRTADLIQSFLNNKGIKTQRTINNVWCFNKYFDSRKPTILLNSHHDTVKPNPAYTFDPFDPRVIDNKLYGLGSNDAGGCLVSLMAAFLFYYEKPDISFNIVFAATAEEEISGHNGLEMVAPQLGPISCAIIGEPTLMDMAVAEKGLLVIDCVNHGKAGHAAREEGENAIYKALNDIEWFRNFSFPKVSEHLGKVKMSVTVLQSGSQHNIVPATCNYTVDIRLTDAYTHQEILSIIKENVDAEITPRSTRLKPSGISSDHALVQAGIKLGRKTYGSPTTSDQALIDMPSIKMGPGDSARSHTADEFIYLHEIQEGISLYIAFLHNFFSLHQNN